MNEYENEEHLCLGGLDKWNQVKICTDFHVSLFSPVLLLNVENVQGFTLT